MEAKYVLDKRDKRSDGTIPLKVKIYQNRDNYTFVSLKIYLKPEQWDGSKIVNHLDESILNPRLKFYKLNIGKILLDADMSNEVLSLKEIHSQVKLSISGAPSPGANSFTDYYQQYIDRIVNAGTKDAHKWTLKKINQFVNNKPIQFSDINTRWLHDFDRFMSDISVNSRWTYFKNLRIVINSAIDEDVANIKYPFRRFKIKQEQTKKRFLTIDQLKKLRDHDCEVEQQQYRDIFMLIFYLRGINIGDLCNLKEITPDGYIEYRRAKTGRLYRIKVEPEALEIIDRYRGKNYLLNILDRYADYHNYTHRLNKNLKEIGHTTIVKDKAGKLRKKEKTGLFPDISSYWARHTWATIAANTGIPIETVSAALGHEVGSKVTAIYIAFDQKKIDEANRKVIDAIK